MFADELLSVRAAMQKPKCHRAPPYSRRDLSGRNKAPDGDHIPDRIVLDRADTDYFAAFWLAPTK
ncbi:hypothetical protein BraRD5C2_55900 [Bradyrhizobium sp. RD5-C2]|nr:hypothetical protein BraRD5C2_55900 [Bradyrhizobium sp. RD5-C2]